MAYVMQQHNIRDNTAGMTQGWQIFGNRLESAIQKHVVDRLTPLNQIPSGQTNFNLGRIPNLHSLIPYSLEARKPVFQCTGTDGLKGAHIQRARDSKQLFVPIANAIKNVIP
jgi:chromosome partitioning protein